MILRVIIEGLLLGLLLIIVCVIAIRKGPVKVVHLYHKDVQDGCVKMGLTTHKKIRKNNIFFKSVCIPGYITYILVCVYAINGARGFSDGFWQLFVILSLMNLTDRFIIDEFWVGHTTAWTIPGTEDLKPYITSHDKCVKWISGLFGSALISAAIAGIMTVFIR